MNRPGSLSTTILLLACLLALVHGLYHWTDTIDDAYISFRYAVNLAAGEGLVFNPGEAVEGYSNLLWTILLSLFVLTGADPMLVAKLAGLATMVLTVFCLHRLLDRTVTSLAAQVAGLALAVLAVPLAYWSLQGMETPLFTLLLCLAFWRFGVELEQPAGLPWSAILLVLACLTRPEGALYLVVIVGVRLVRGRRSWRRDLTWLAAFLVPMLGHLTWRWFTYGELLPNTYYAKGMAGVSFLSMTARSEGLAYVGAFFASAWGLPAILGLLGLLAAGMSLLPGKAEVGRSRLLLPLLWLAVALFFAWHANGDWMPHSRFLVPGLPALALLVAVGVDGCSRWFRGRVGLVTPWLLTLVLAAGLLAQAGAEGRWRLPVLSGGQSPRLLPMAMALMETLRDGETVVYGDIGVVGYLNPRLRIIDNRGLTHKTMGRILYNRPHRMDEAGRLREQFLEAFGRIRPEAAVVVINQKARAPVWNTEIFALHPGFQRNYVEVQRLTHRRNNSEIICLRRDLVQRQLPLAEVIAHYQRAIRMAPRISELYFRLAEICRDGGRRQLRQETLEALGQRFAGDRRVMRRLEKATP